MATLAALPSEHTFLEDEDHQAALAVHNFAAGCLDPLATDVSLIENVTQSKAERDQLVLCQRNEMLDTEPKFKREQFQHQIEEVWFLQSILRERRMACWAGDASHRRGGW
jgi:hypothetical protein